MTNNDQCGLECHKDNTTKMETKRKQNPKRVGRDCHYLGVRALAGYLSGRAAP